MIIIGEGYKKLKYNYNILKEFCEYMELAVNPTKSAVTNNRDKLKILKFNGEKIAIRRKNETYKYLGLHISLDGLWKEQKEINKKYMLKTINYINRRQLTTLQKTQLVNMVVNSCIAYQMQVIRFEDCFLEQLDKSIINIIKKNMRAHAGGLNEVIFLDRNMGQRSNFIERLTNNSLYR